MYTRFYNSIINPKEIVNFRNDSLVKVFLYLMFFALLLSTTPIIKVLTFDGIEENTKEVIKRDFNDVNDTCIITESVMSCEKQESTLLYEDLMFSVYTDSYSNFNPSIYTESGYNLVFYDDSLHVVISGNDALSILVSDLPEEFHNLDFSLYQTDPNAFFDSVFDGIDDFLVTNHTYWGSGIIIIDFVSNVTLFLLFVLLSSWMLRMRYQEVRFKQLWIMTVYSSTALYLILIINSLYNLSFFIVVILLIVAFRQNSQLSMELYRRLRKKP